MEEQVKKDLEFEKIKEQFVKISNFLEKHYLLIILAVYIIGSIALMIRNKIIGIPFQIFNLQQYVITIFYWIMISILQFIVSIPLVVIKICYHQELEFKYKTKQIVTVVFSILFILFNAIILLILNLVIDINNIKFLLYFYLPMFIIFPICRYIINWKKFIYKFFDIIFYIYAITVLFYIPINLGGFEYIKVNYIPYSSDIIENSNLYYSYEEKTTNEYEYYGITDSLYILKEGNTLYLVPVDSGYIKYELKN